MEDLNYIMDAIEFIGKYGSKFLKFYLFQPHSGSWTHINEEEVTMENKLSAKFLLNDKFYAKDEK